MTPKQKVLAIRLSEKIYKMPEYAKNIGIEIKNQTKRRIQNDRNNYHGLSSIFIS